VRSRFTLHALSRTRSRALAHALSLSRTHAHCTALHAQHCTHSTALHAQHALSSPPPPPRYKPGIEVRRCSYGLGLFATGGVSDAQRNRSILNLWACASAQCDDRPTRSAFYFCNGQRRFITGPLSLGNHQCVSPGAIHYAFRQGNGEVRVKLVGSKHKTFEHGEQVPPPPPNTQIFINYSSEGMGDACCCERCAT
jgi:hypothetical protein